VRLDLKAWVNRRRWETGPRYKVIDNVRECWASMDRPELGDDPETIVGSTFGLFLHDQEFVKYVLEECSQDVTTDEEWEEIARAYAWVILQRYNRELGGDHD